ncbi:calcium release-activated calcium channel protein 1-like isoform X2 [Neocloeon triangulifer]|nr:calcium release-activated calcium channel protein 1-like isoform X2 [Neocloeon triangulifer]
MSQDDLLSHQQSLGQLSQAPSALNVSASPRRPLSLHISSNPGSPHPPPRSNTGRVNSLRKAALVLRATQSTASLQSSVWPAPSRSQSALVLQPPPSAIPATPCCNCCCGHPDGVLPQYIRSPSFTSAEDDPEKQSNVDGTLTPTGLSWRRLHVSRAKLKATSTTSELLSGFAMVAMVELQINTPTNVPEWMFILFSVCTTVLVAVHIFALMIATYILPNIDAITRLHASELVLESPHEKMRFFIELAWGLSTVLGLFLFLVEVAILCWVKFWDYSFASAVASTAIAVPSLLIFIGFAVHFYHTLVVHKCKASDLDLQALEKMKTDLENKLKQEGAALPTNKPEEKFSFPPGYNNV